jgi:hypothetical protein
MFRVPNWRVLGACAWLVAAAVAVGACAGAPVQTMSDARQAIRAAEAAGAATVAPDQLSAARGELKRAEESLRAGDYRAARREAEAAHAQAIGALTAAQSPPTAH